MASPLWLPASPRGARSEKQLIASLHLTVPVSTVYPELRADFPTFRRLLGQLSRTDTLLWCARLNVIVSNPLNSDHRAKQQYCLSTMCSPSEIDRINAFMREHPGHEIAAFFRGQLLDLMSWTALLSQDLPGDGSTFDDQDVRRIFVQAALIAGDLWSRRIYEPNFSLEGGLEAARRRALGPVRSSLETTDPGVGPIQSLMRARALNGDILSARCAGFPDEFRCATGMSLEDYCDFLTLLIIHLLNRRPENVSAGFDHAGGFHVDAVLRNAPELQSRLPLFMARHAHTADAMRSSLWRNCDLEHLTGDERYDLRALRSRPILATPDGRAMVLDPVFLCDKATLGPLFAVVDHRRSEGARSDDLFQSFGEAFEDYGSAALRRAFPKPSEPLADRLECDVRGRDNLGHEVQIADACLNDVSELTLFEMKAVWLRDDRVAAQDHELYLEHLRTKYCTSAEGHPKGVGQLARAIGKLETGDWTPNSQDFSRVQRIFPVLLVYDALLGAPVYPEFLAEEFRALLEPDTPDEGPYMCKGRFRVAPLTVMTIDDLEALEGSIGAFSLVQLLKDYTAACSHREFGLRSFIYRTHYAQLMRPSAFLRHKADEAFRQALRRLAPDQPIPEKLQQTTSGREGSYWAQSSG